MFAELTPGLDIVERYGVLGLLTLVVVAGIKIGWEQIKTLKSISITLRVLLKKIGMDADSTAKERDRAVLAVREDIADARNEIIRAIEGHSCEP